jgi:hypothetical protein
MYTIIGIQFNIPSDEDDFISFRETGSLSDADIAIFRSNFIEVEEYRLGETPYHEGKRRFDEYSSSNVKQNSKHWSAEIRHLLDFGKTVIILLCAKEDFYIDTGRKEFNGKRQINYVEEYNNYKFLPNNDFQIKNASGSKIYSNSILLKGLYDQLKDYFITECYVVGEKIPPDHNLFRFQKLCQITC